MLWSNHRDGTYTCKNPKFNAEKENANDPREKVNEKLTARHLFKLVLSWCSLIN